MQDEQAKRDGESPALEAGDGGAIVASGISQIELSQLLATFNAASSRLATTHESLQREVAKLRAELAETKVHLERSRHLALLGEMAAGIAHEVRNPLGSILLYARMLQTDLAEQPSLRITADKIASSVQRLEGVVSEVLVFSRQQAPKSEVVDVDDLLEMASEQGMLGGYRAKVFPSKLKVLGDARQLMQVLVNLVRNGCEAMRDAGLEPKMDGSDLILSARASSVRELDGSTRQMVVINVRDHGPGLKDSAKDEVFKPFFTTRAEGTGLGLAIVHRLIDAHGGRIKLGNWIKEHPIREGMIGGAVAEVWLPDAQSSVSRSDPAIQGGVEGVVVKHRAVLAETTGDNR
jgi:signal transduction histidine kinase